MHMHMFWHAPKLTQPSHRSPGSAMSAESSVGNVTNRAAKERQPVSRWLPALRRDGMRLNTPIHYPLLEPMWMFLGMHLGMQP